MHEEIQEFLDIVEGTDKADGTIESYRRALREYSDWVTDNSLDLEAVSHRDLKRYLAYLKNEEGYAPNTIRVRFSAVSQFYEDITADGANFDDPTDPVKVSEYAPRTTKKEEITKEKHVWMTEEEVEEIVENVPPPRLRNRLLVLFQYFTALHRQEVVDVKLSDLDREKRTVTVRGKGGTNNVAHWQPKLDGLLTAWIDGGYRNASPYARRSDYLFPSESTPQLSPHRVNSIVVEAAKNAGIQEVLYTDANGRDRYKFTSHTLRHSFAVHFLKNGGSFEGLSKLLAHSSVETTEIYGEILDDRAKDEYEKYAPDIDLSL